MGEKFKFEFSFGELNIIIKALKELPYKESNSLIEKIIGEYEKQALEIQKTVKEKEEKEPDKKENSKA